MSTKLQIQDRDSSKNPRQIRESGFIPASLYGKGMESKNVQVNTHEFELSYRDNSDNNWELTFGKEKMNARIQELQKNHATNEFLNIEFQIV